MKKIDLMNQLVADLSVLNTKFHNLHWNVVGERFEPVHVHVEKLYDMLFEQYDEVAERIKMLGEFPLASVKSYLDTTSVKELESKDYQIDEVYTIVKAELENLRTQAVEIREVADEEGDFVTVAMVEDMVAVYDKELWFIAQSMK